jgi:hypothetical protein
MLIKHLITIEKRRLNVKKESQVLPVNEYQLTKDKTNYQGEWL